MFKLTSFTLSSASFFFIPQTGFVEGFHVVRVYVSFHYSGFQVGPTFPIFPTFLICSYFSLLFHENALLSLLFHSKMSFTCKNQEFFLARSEFYRLTSMFNQRARGLTPQN